MIDEEAPAGENVLHEAAARTQGATDEPVSVAPERIRLAAEQRDSLGPRRVEQGIDSPQVGFSPRHLVVVWLPSGSQLRVTRPAAELVSCVAVSNLHVSERGRKSFRIGPAGEATIRDTAHV